MWLHVDSNQTEKNPLKLGLLKSRTFFLVERKNPDKNYCIVNLNRWLSSLSLKGTEKIRRGDNLHFWSLWLLEEY
jgi:hypothetical protein